MRWREDSHGEGLEEISPPTGYLTVYRSGLIPLVEVRQKDQEGDIPWALKGGSGPGSPEAKGKEPQGDIRTS